MSSSAADATNPVNESVKAPEDAVSPEVFREIYELGKAGSGSACINCTSEKKSLALPITLGYMLTFAYFGWLGANHYFKGVEEQRQTVLWQEFFKPALLGETTRGLHFRTVFASSTRMDLLRSSVPSEDSTKSPEDWLAVGRAWIVLEDGRKSTKAFENAEALATSPLILNSAKAELLALRGDVQAAADLLLTALSKATPPSIWADPAVPTVRPAVAAETPVNLERRQSIPNLIPVSQVDDTQLHPPEGAPVDVTPNKFFPAPMTFQHGPGDHDYQIASTALARFMELGAEVRLPCGFPMVGVKGCEDGAAAPAAPALPAEAPVPPLDMSPMRPRQK